MSRVNGPIPASSVTADPAPLVLRPCDCGRSSTERLSKIEAAKDVWVLLDDAIVLTALRRPAGNNQSIGIEHIQTCIVLTLCADNKSLQLFLNIYFQLDVCCVELSDSRVSRGDSFTTGWWLELWRVMPGTCCHAEGMRICWVPAGQACWRTTKYLPE